MWLRRIVGFVAGFGMLVLYLIFYLPVIKRTAEGQAQTISEWRSALMISLAGYLAAWIAGLFGVEFSPPQRTLRSRLNGWVSRLGAPFARADTDVFAVVAGLVFLALFVAPAGWAVYAVTQHESLAPDAVRALIGLTVALFAALSALATLRD